MEKTESIRERLLSRLPQTDDIAAYKEEVAMLLAKHDRALFRDVMAAKVMMFAAAITGLVGLWMAGWEPHSAIPRLMIVLSCSVFLMGAIQGARHRVSQSQLELLKEIKQLQVQILELQTSMRKSDDAEL